MKPIAEACNGPQFISIVVKSDSLSTLELNYWNKVKSISGKRRVSLLRKGAIFFDCINQSGDDIVLIDEEGIWGVYALNREDTDLLASELGILKLQKTYGEGSSR